MALDKQHERWPLSVRLSEEEMELLKHLQNVMECQSLSQVIKRLIRAAYVRPASVKFLRPEEDKALA